MLRTESLFGLGSTLPIRSSETCDLPRDAGVGAGAGLDGLLGAASACSSSSEHDGWHGRRPPVLAQHRQLKQTSPSQHCASSLRWYCAPPPGAISFAPMLLPPAECIRLGYNALTGAIALVSHRLSQRSAKTSPAVHDSMRIVACGCHPKRRMQSSLGVVHHDSDHTRHHTGSMP